MFEAISATIFFGTPFKGAEIAAWAAMYSHLPERTKNPSQSKLLDFVKPGDSALRELRQEFQGLVTRLSPNIRVVCFWEQEQTDFSRLARLSDQFEFSRSLIPGGLSDVVSQESATLDGAQHAGLAGNHCDLVKFDGPKDGRWIHTVRRQLKLAINGARLVAKNRVASARGVDWSSYKGVMEALGGYRVDRKRRDLERTVSPSSWITEDSNYSSWLATSKKQDKEASPTILPTVDCLWIRGREGRGKTGAAIACLGGVETLIQKTEVQCPSRDAILLAYFFCDTSTNYCTAEDLLKSLLCQLVSQQPALAGHARPFVRSRDRDGSSAFRAQVSVENLWQRLQNMLSDGFIGRRVYIIINNLHVLPENSDSTRKLMNYLGTEMRDAMPDSEDGQSWKVSTRWLITSRDSSWISGALRIPSVRLLDVEESKYGGKVQQDLRKYAKAKVATLEAEKKYNKALAYFVSSLIGERAPSVHWIDITCVQLWRLSEEESHLKVRRVLENTPQDLNDLLNESWGHIFAANAGNDEKLKDVLRALVLTYEDPTEAELAVLAGMSASSDEKRELRELLLRCKPLLSVKRTVCFMNPGVKAHLLENSRLLLDLCPDEIRWQHGILALRSLSHLKKKFDFPASEKSKDFEPGKSGDVNQEPAEDRDPEADILRNKALPYPVKFWLRHGSKATAEFADDLSMDEFWEPGSLIRHRWLVEYMRMTNDLEYFSIKSMTSLHVAAAIGFRQLMSSLINNGHEGDINNHDSLSLTPVRIKLTLFLAVTWQG